MKPSFHFALKRLKNVVSKMRNVFSLFKNISKLVLYYQIKMRKTIFCNFLFLLSNFPHDIWQFSMMWMDVKIGCTIIEAFIRRTWPLPGLIYRGCLHQSPFVRPCRVEIFSTVCKNNNCHYICICTLYHIWRRIPHRVFKPSSSHSPQRQTLLTPDIKTQRSIRDEYW